MANLEQNKPLKHVVAFKVVLSTKMEVKCDPDEVQRVLEGIGTGSIIRLRQGIINPSYIVALVEDEERNKSYREEVSQVLKHNEFDRDYHGGNNQRGLPEPKHIKDILVGIQLTKKPALGGGVDQLKLTGEKQ